MTLPVAILAGGLATRLRPLTTEVPKVLVEVAGQPFAVHQLALLRRQGLTRVIFCIGHLGEQVVAALGDGRQWGMHIGYSFDGDRLLGTGGALRQALPLLGEAFFVLYGDSYLACDYTAVAAAFQASGQLGLMTVFRNDGQWDQSNVWYAGGRILRYDKHAPIPAMQHIDYGLGVLSARVFEAYQAGTELDLATIYQDLLGRGQLAALEVQQRFYEIGSPAGLKEMRQVLSRPMGTPHVLRATASG